MLSAGKLGSRIVRWASVYRGLRLGLVVAVVAATSAAAQTAPEPVDPAVPEAPQVGRQHRGADRYPDHRAADGWGRDAGGQSPAAQ
jgi:hypothetical protein